MYKRQEYAFAYDKAIVDDVHSLGAKVKLHICGNITALLPQLRDCLLYTSSATSRRQASAL